MHDICINAIAEKNGYHIPDKLLTSKPILADWLEENNMEKLANAIRNITKKVNYA